MKPKKSIPTWKNKTIYEKILNIVGMIISFIIIFLAFLEIFEIYNFIYILESLFGFFMLIQTLQYWKYDTKNAIICLGVTIIIFICCIIVIFVR